MRSMAIRVYSKIHSEEVQKLLFKLGYKWQSCGETITNTSADVLYAHSSGAITYNTPYEYNEYTEEDLVRFIMIETKQSEHLNKLTLECIGTLLERRKTLTTDLVWVDEQIVRQIEMLNKA